MVIDACPVIIAAATAFIMAAPAARADDTGSNLLGGSTQGFVLGPTGIPDPAIFPGYTHYSLWRSQTWACRSMHTS
jgi:hypothetical protein